jgi:hypothetical protein
MTSTLIFNGESLTALGFAPGHLFGLTLSNNGTDATNDIDIAAGKCADSANAANMVLASALTKRLDAAWAVGTNQGGLDTGSIANATYHIWLIKRPDTGVVDALFSTSATSPTMPANYTLKRRIGSIVRVSNAIKAFVQDGDMFMWKTPAADIAAANPGVSAVTRTLTLPTGIRIEAIVSVGTSQATAADGPGSVLLSDLSITDNAPIITAAFTFDFATNAAGYYEAGGTARVFTNTSAQIRSRLQASAAGTTLYINTQGWIDTRGRLS